MKNKVLTQWRNEYYRSFGSDTNRIKNTFVRINTRSKHIEPSDLLDAGYPNVNIRYGHNFNEIEAWCDKTFGKNNVCWFGYLFFFQTEQQKLLFMLRFP